MKSRYEVYCCCNKQVPGLPAGSVTFSIDGALTASLPLLLSSVAWFAAPAASFTPLGPLQWLVSGPVTQVVHATELS
jgi:hypothetical protein